MTSDKLISHMQSTTRVLWSASALLAPWLVPVGSAILFGWAMFQAALVLGLPPFLAGVVGVTTACGLETVNIAAAHAAIHLSHDRKRNGGRFGLACILIGFYVVLGIGAMLTLPVRPEIHAIGAAMFLLTPVAITAQALALDIGRVQQETDTRQAREDERRRLAIEDQQAQQAIEAQRIALEFEVLKTERYKADAAVRLAKAQAGTERPEHVPVKAGTGTPQERAAAVLAHTPDLSGEALARIIGVSGGYGRKLKNGWLATDRNGSGGQ